MKLYILFMLVIGLISCAPSKKTDRIPAANSCSNTEISLTEMRNNLISGKCNNMQYFCDASSLEANAFFLSHEDNKNKMAENRTYINDEVHNSYKTKEPWSLSMWPSLTFRKKAYSIDDKFSKWSMESIIDYIKKDYEPISEDNKSKIHDKIEAAFGREEAQTETMTMNTSAYRALICAKITVRYALDCKNSIERILEFMGQRKGMVLPELNKLVHTTDTYGRGMQRLALKMMDYVEAGVAPQSNLFDDTYKSYREEGLSKKEATEHTWNSMAILAMGGPNYGLRAADWFAIHKLSPQVVAPFLYVAKTLPLLSHYGRSNKKYYGLPSNVNVSCDNGKHYHFWMSSYLTWRLIQEGYKPYGAAAASYSIFKGYQHLSRSANRDPERALSVDTFDGWNNIMRFDMVYSSAGIRFALGKANNAEIPLDIDAGVKLILKQSKETLNIRYEDSKRLFAESPKTAFLNWDVRFKPDGVFKLYNNR